MENNSKTKQSSFYAIGLNYKKADAEVRGKFSLDEEAKNNILNQAIDEGIESLIVISTCNRTELYGFAENPFQIIKPLCENSNGTLEDFHKVAYIYKNDEAVSHLFRVGTGLDSQILGDFEIVSQIKLALLRSRAKGLVKSFMERLINSVIQASKRVKNETQLSSGATSVSFASVQYIMNNIEDVSNKNILLFGTGKIGRNTCENLVKHTKNKHITLINRTKDKAEKIAGKFNLIVDDYSNLKSQISYTDIMVVATGAKKPTIDKTILNSNKPLLILDLSIPKNVNENVLDIPGVKLVHLDSLSQITDKTLEKRKQFIPQTETIIEEVKTEFLEWVKARQFAPAIHSLKSKLETIKNNELNYLRKKTANFNEEQAELISTRLIQKITTQFANHIKNDDTMINDSIELIEKIFQIDSKTND